MGARQEILRSIRQSLAAGEPRTRQRIDELRARLRTTSPKVQPQFDDDLLARFCQKHVNVHGTYERIRRSEIEVAVLRHLKGLEIDPQLHVGSGPILQTVKWSEHVFTYSKGADKNTRVALSEAFAAVAETGTLMMCSGPHSPPSHNFLPDDHIVLVHQERIVRCQEDVWPMVRQLQGFPPRAINFITGPSKTGDIEQTIQYGAHGPRRLHILIVEE